MFWWGTRMPSHEHHASAWDELSYPDYIHRTSENPPRFTATLFTISGWIVPHTTSIYSSGWVIQRWPDDDLRPWCICALQPCWVHHIPDVIAIMNRVWYAVRPFGVYVPLLSRSIGPFFLSFIVPLLSFLLPPSSFALFYRNAWW